MRQLTKNSLLLMSLFALCISTVFALPSDKTKPASISADSAQFNRNTGIGIYTGDVIVIQGSTKITANKIITYNNKNNKIYKAIAIGKPAHYQTLPKEDQPIFQASASRITFYPITRNVILDGDGKVIQGKNSLSGPKIFYNMKSGEVKTTPTAHQRTTLIFQPNALPTLPKSKAVA